MVPLQFELLHPEMLAVASNGSRLQERNSQVAVKANHRPYSPMRRCASDALLIRSPYGQQGRDRELATPLNDARKASKRKEKGATSASGQLARREIGLNNVTLWSVSVGSAIAPADPRKREATLDVATCTVTVM